MIKEWNIYLSGEIHTDWRDEIRSGVETHGLPMRFTGPVLDHETSDMIGVRILGDARVGRRSIGHDSTRHQRLSDYLEAAGIARGDGAGVEDDRTARRGGVMGRATGRRYIAAVVQFVGIAFGRQSKAGKATNTVLSVGGNRA